MKTHHDLDVWKEAIELVTLVYKYTDSFPKSEMYGLTNQIRRSAVSIPSNISEGAARNTSKDFSHFLAIALGSIAELETQLIIAQNIDFLSLNQLEELINKLVPIRRMTLGLKKTLQNS
jgi:four helix bundle protein